MSFLSKNKFISLSFSLNVKFINLSSIILTFNELILFNMKSLSKIKFKGVFLIG